MSTKILDEGFDTSNLPSSLQWYCPPKRWSIANSQLVVEPEAKTDYWQKTHYGFSVDNGPFLYMILEDDFLLSTSVQFFPQNQYDQAGLMVRFDADHWLKTSVEYELDGPNQLGVVVTNYGYSDWSTQPFPAGLDRVELRVQRRGDDYIVQYSPPGDQENWSQLRMARLHNPGGVAAMVGLYACSPTGAGYHAEFEYLRVDQNSGT